MRVPANQGEGACHGDVFIAAQDGFEDVLLDGRVVASKSQAVLLQFDP